MFGHTVSLKSSPNVAYMLNNLQCPCGPLHTLQTTWALQQVETLVEVHMMKVSIIQILDVWVERIEVIYFFRQEFSWHTLHFLHK